MVGACGALVAPSSSQPPMASFSWDGCVSQSHRRTLPAPQIRVLGDHGSRAAAAGRQGQQGRVGGVARRKPCAAGATAPGAGYAACAYIDTAAADKFNEACVIFTGVATHDAFLDAPVKKASQKALLMGVKVGMPGRAALNLLR